MRAFIDRWWRGTLGTSLVFVVMLAMGYMIFKGVRESNEADRAKKAKRDREHQEALRSLDEISRGMTSMAEITKQLLKEDIERIKKETERLEARNKQLRKVFEALEQNDRPGTLHIQSTPAALK